VPGVRLELRQGASRPSVHEISGSAFLIGSVPGCDLRLPGADLPPVICLVARVPGGAEIRRLVPTHPVFVNGRSVTSAPLAHGDSVKLGPLEFLVHLDASPPAQEVPPKKERTQPPAPGPDQGARFEQERQTFAREYKIRRQELEELSQQLGIRQQKLDEQTQELEADRVIWYRRREEIEQECKRQVEMLAKQAAAPQPAAVDKELAQRGEELAQRQREVEAAAEQLRKQQQEFTAIRQELADIRQQLYDRYRKRRDRLAGLHEAVDRAARKVQENKRQVDGEVQRSQARKQEEAARSAELDAQAAELERSRQLLEEKERLLAGQQEALAKVRADYQAREQDLDKERTALEAKQAQYQADLVRLDRFQASVEQRQQQLQARAREVDQRSEQLQRTSREIEGQAKELDEWHDKLRREAEQLTRQKTEQEAANSQLAQRAAALEGQQAMLASLRTRLERMREELRRDQQQVTEQQARLHAAEADVQQRHQDAQQKQLDLERDQGLREQERLQIDQRRTALEAAVSQLRLVQDQLDLKEHELQERARIVEESAAKQQEVVQQLEARSAQVLETQQRLEADRQALRERQTTLLQTEQAREALQEQLRRRSDELTSRQRALSEQAQKLAQDSAALDTIHADVQKERGQAAEGLAGLRQDLESRASELDRLRAELEQREQQLHRNVEHLKEAGRNIGSSRKALSIERAQWLAAQQEAAAATKQTRADLEKMHHEVVALQEHLPELELRARAASDRLAHAREQLREHLGELHAYVRQSQEEIESSRAQLQAEAEQMRQQRLELQRARDDHRLGVASFRQQLIEWQGQVADMKRSLVHDETRLERRQAQVDERARQIDAGSARLAQQAEQLQQQERVVLGRRQEMERHLDDMREWYRRKLRELSLTRAPAATGNNAEDAGRATSAGDRDILSLAEEMDPGDRKLGELLRSLNLVDADTLASLMVEARRQHRTLRQALLAGGYLTLYQMALIETGNLDGLVLGSFRVIDRVRVTAQEAVYRVFDPSRGHEALLRHLSEVEMEDAVHPDEFRQRFRQAAALQHPNLAATFEVLDIGDRPAALQEWLAGLPSGDWPSLAAVPGVWYRLVCQAALGLHMAHQAGLIHGHLLPDRCVLTESGILKLCGLGEPAWLVVPPRMDGQQEDINTDLADLGRLATGWANVAPRRKGIKTKPLPDALQAILVRLSSEKPEEHYASAGSLLEDLERAGADLAPNTEAWDRLLLHVREHNAGGQTLRQSA